MIGNKRANIPSTTEMAGKKDLPSPSSPGFFTLDEIHKFANPLISFFIIIVEAVEDDTIDDHSYCLKRKLGLETYLGSF